MESLISCILPTRNRAPYIGLAIQSFISQTYPRKELVIVDNGEDGTEGIVPLHPHIVYEKVRGEKNVGEMRNLCCELARGDIICHFDSDDWSIPERLALQYQFMGERWMTGFRNILFWDERTQQTYYYEHPDIEYCLGTSLFYRRSWWEREPFSSVKHGEDFLFIKALIRFDRTQFRSSTEGDKVMVARLHNGQTARKTLLPPLYQPIEGSPLLARFQCALT